MPRVASKKSMKRHDPLDLVISQDEALAKYGRVSQPGRRTKKHRVQETDDAEEFQGVLDAKTSKNILALAKDQQDEIEEDEWVDEEESNPPEALNGLDPRIRVASNIEDDEDDKDMEGSQEEYEYLDIDPEDMNALDKLLPSTSGQQRTLADLIFEKIDSAGAQTTPGVPPAYKADGSLDPAAGLDPKIVAVYTKVGELLQRGRYKSGPVPKVFKILPSHDQWARYLALTSPQNWSPQATFVATKIFISNLKPEQSRVFLEGVVLPNVREDIKDNFGRLNVHLYNALKKGLYKPAAFFKGVLFPLCKNGCTLKEASIVGSVLSRVHVPVLHSAAALLRLATMEYSGPNSLFIRVLLDKKYALPYQVVDGLWSHFVRLANSHKGSKAGSEQLPVLWHQSLLVFCQRYASDMTPDQKDALLDVLRLQFHSQIGPEIRRELVNSVARGEPRLAEDHEMQMV